MGNVVQKRTLLEEEEKRLHEQLAEQTRQLQMAQAKVKFYEDAMDRTLADLLAVRQQRDELTSLMEGTWNSPRPRNGASPTA
jgi:hypothetical protein